MDIRSLQRVVSRLGQLISRRALMPDIAQEVLQPHFACVEVDIGARNHLIESNEGNK